jgi:hypothetical protein
VGDSAWSRVTSTRSRVASARSRVTSTRSRVASARSRVARRPRPNRPRVTRAASDNQATRRLSLLPVTNLLGEKEIKREKDKKKYKLKKVKFKKVKLKESLTISGERTVAAASNSLREK